VTKTPLFLVKLDYIEDSTSSCFVVLSFCYCLGSKNIVASFEFRVHHFVGESSSTNGNTGKDTIALVLMHYKARLNTSRNLVSVGNNATNEVRLSFVECGHQIVKLTLEIRRDGLSTSLLLPVLILGSFKWLTRMISKALDSKAIASILDHLNNGVVKRILVLFKPTSQIIGHSSSIMDNCEVSIGIWSRVGLGKVCPFSEKISMKLLTESLISSFREKGFFLKNSKKSHGFFKHVNTFLKIHSKVNICPVKTLLDILLLFKGEHMLVEKLLEFFIDIVNANLFEPIIVEDFEACYIKHANIRNLFHGWVNECFITFFDNNTESTFVDGTSNT